MSADLRFERLIAAPPERVFAAFTAPEGQAAFYGKDTAGWIVESDCDLRPGGAWSIAFGPSRAELYRHRHEFLAIEPPRRLLMATTEFRPDGSSFETTTEFTFDPDAGGTRMTMVQAGFPTTDLRDEHTIGVPHAVDRLERELGRDHEE
jgi:uncharacterized protein YndB with AHSA1/START domain